MKVFPNPSNGIVNISLPSNDSYTLLIIDIQGRIVSKKEGINDAQIQLNLSDWNSGIYFVNLSTKNRVFNSKILIQ
jgi:Secretion system C-terminal sorting domain